MYDLLNLFGKSKYGSTFVLSRISCIASGLALLKNEQKIMHGDVLALIKHRSRRFRHSLNKFYVQPGVSLFKRFGFITPNEWNNFQQLHSSLEAMVDSNRMKELI
jgi:hypothetical protein